jgi:hypothetical protein
MLVEQIKRRANSMTDQKGDTQQKGTQEGATDPTHHPGARKGEEIIKDEGKEQGRHDSDATGAGRPSGGSTSRDSTRINPENEKPIDEESPNMPPA